MIKVEMPLASWETVMISLETLMQQGYILKGEYLDICDQVYKQEG